MGDLRQQHDELVAALPAHRIRTAHRRGQPLRDRLQEPIADAVAERVVDVLEPIDVEKQHRQLPLVAPRDGNGADDALFEQHAVRQARERIVRRHVRHLQQRFVGEPVGALGVDGQLLCALQHLAILIRQVSASQKRVAEQLQQLAELDQPGLGHRLVRPHRFPQALERDLRVAGQPLDLLALGEIRDGVAGDERTDRFVLEHEGRSDHRQPIRRHDAERRRGQCAGQRSTGALVEDAGVVRVFREEIEQRRRIHRPTDDVAIGAVGDNGEIGDGGKGFKGGPPHLEVEQDVVCRAHQQAVPIHLILSVIMPGVAEL